MKANRFEAYGDANVIQWVEVEMPKPQPNQVLIKVIATSINYADVMTRKGKYHRVGSQFPRSLGLDVVGTIEVVGEKVSGFKIGDLVLAYPLHGSYDEYILAEDNLIFKLPDDIDINQVAACAFVGFTAQMVLEQVAHIKKGDVVIIHGIAGSLGRLAAQIAKHRGATVIGTLRKEHQRLALQTHDIDLIINTMDEDFVHVVNAYTHNHGVDIILDPIGGEMTRLNMKILAPFGRLIILNNASGSYQQIDTADLHASCRSVQGFSIGSTRTLRPEWFQNSADVILPMIATGALKCPIEEIFDLSDANKAHQHFETKDRIGKILLRAHSRKDN